MKRRDSIRIVAASGPMRDCLSAVEVNAALSRGIGGAGGGISLEPYELADGGDGTLAAFSAWSRRSFDVVDVRDAQGNSRELEALLFLDGETCVIEMARICGLATIAARERNPMMFVTSGVGDAVRVALDRGARTILVAAGGSATIDAGAGALAALGVRFLDETGKQVARPTPDELARVRTVDLARLDPRVGETAFVVLGDTDIPLVENAAVYGGQKGLREADRAVVEEAVGRVLASGPYGPPEPARAPWLGAGGGMAAGLATYLGAEVVSGARYCITKSGVDAALHGAELAITVEGRFDGTSLHGKLSGGLIEATGRARVPIVVVAGEVHWATIEGLLPSHVTCFSLQPGPRSHKKALSSAPQDIERLARQLAQLLSNRGNPRPTR